MLLGRRLTRAFIPVFAQKINSFQLYAGELSNGVNLPFEKGMER
jgi:hypothetical protein